ncbi:hypothetical protein C0Q70_02613 [Pomacea canaliculata]|uniref:Uncharacterized protein n=1 Tax=Pomacea canaliculata TaxID=400727 RepID=A0A2T7PQH9_POMCA|nr:hypothetical protein C0Q70_02613 [Pomacea canaliculata]
MCPQILACASASATTHSPEGRQVSDRMCSTFFSLITARRGHNQQQVSREILSRQQQRQWEAEITAQAGLVTSAS